MPKTFKSMKSYRKYSAFIHIHNVPHRRAKTRKLKGGKILSTPYGPKVRGKHHTKCAHCGRKLRY